MVVRRHTIMGSIVLFGWNFYNVGWSSDRYNTDDEKLSHLGFSAIRERFGKNIANVTKRQY